MERIGALTLAFVLTIFLFPLDSVWAQSKSTKLGFISILTGPYSDVGQAMAKSAQLAVEDYQARYPQEEIELVIEDDGADPKKALSAYLKLKNADKADIIMPTSTFAIGVLRDRVNRQRDLTFILGNEPYEPTDDFIYMLSPAGVPAETGLGEYVAKEHPEGGILIIASQNEAFFRFARAAQAGTGGRGEIIEIPSGADFSAIALAVKARRPVALIFNGLPLESAKLLKELRRIGFTTALYFDDSIGNSLSDFQTVLGSLTGLKHAKILNLASHMDSSFRERYSKRFKESPRMWSDYAYDAVSLALLLKDRPVEDARLWLNKNTYQGVSGRISFDAAGLRLPEYSIIPIAEHPSFQGKF